MFNWSGKKALITGGSCEIALKLGEQMIHEGIFPVMTYRTPAGREQIETFFRESTGSFSLCHLDFSSPETLKNIDSSSEEPPDYLVDFAQGSFESLVATASPEAVSAFVGESITFRAALLKSVTRQMLKKKRGRLLFVSSTAAGLPNPGQGFYSAVKQAGEALYKSIAIELASKGISAVSIRPGYVDAGRGRRYVDGKETEIVRKIPLGRVLTPDEVASAIMYLLSDSAVGINGTEIVMDGGLTSCK